MLNRTHRKNVLAPSEFVRSFRSFVRVTCKNSRTIVCNSFGYRITLIVAESRSKRKETGKNEDFSQIVRKRFGDMRKFAYLCSVFIIHKDK